MKKTQKILSLVVALALALSVCSLSASAKSIISGTTIDENIATVDFSTDQTLKASSTVVPHTGSATSIKAGGAVSATAANGALTITGRTILDVTPYPTEGTYAVGYMFKTTDENPSVALNIFRCGPNGNFTASTSVASTISGGKDTLTAYGVTTTIEPNEWYNFEAVVNMDSNTIVATVDGTVVLDAAYTAASLGRIIDIPVSGRTLVIDDLYFNKITQTVIEDGVTNVMTEDFSSKTSISATTKFYDASGSTAFNKQSDACSAVSVVDGTMLVGTRYILNPATALNSGTYTVAFDFKVPAQETGANTFIFSAQNSTTGGFSTFIHYPNSDGKGHIWVNNASAMAVTAEEWHEYVATFDFTSKKYVVTVDDQQVQSGTFTADQFTRLFHATTNNGHAIYYDNIVINQVTKDYEVMEVTKANGTITARFVNNVAPKARFFAAIYENGALSSLKVLDDVANLEEVTVGTYDADDVTVKFYTWAKKGLMPLADVVVK